MIFKNAHSSFIPAGRINFLRLLKTLGATALALGVCQSNASEALARKNDCLGCHAMAAKLVGPAFKDVAAKYAGKGDALESVTANIRNGGAGNWGELPMPAQTKLTPADAKKLATWILNSK